MPSTPPFRPQQLAKVYLQNARMHYDTVAHTANTIQQQNTALGIASHSLDLNILALAEAFEPFAQNTQQVLTNQKQLLSSLNADLAAISAIRIHAAFLSPAVRKAVEDGGLARTLGDYVATDKMRQVAEGCGKLSGASPSYARD